MSCLILIANSKKANIDENNNEERWLTKDEYCKEIIFSCECLKMNCTGIWSDGGDGYCYTKDKIAKSDRIGCLEWEVN